MMQIRVSVKRWVGAGAGVGAGVGVYPFLKNAVVGLGLGLLQTELDSTQSSDYHYLYEKKGNITGISTETLIMKKKCNECDNDCFLV